jgi:hypothetical protein
MEQAAVEEIVSNYTDVISGAAIAAPEEASEEGNEEAVS